MTPAPSSGDRFNCKQPTNWTFGVQTDDADAQAVHGYFVKWSNRDQDWDYLPGGNEPILPPDSHGFTWLAHAKLNVVRSVKRGLSDFYPIQGNLDIARRVLRNMGEGSAVQAAIAWIQEVALGTTQAQAHSGTLSRADVSYTTRTAQGSDRTHYVQQYDPATILKVPSGQKYLPGPLAAQNAASFISAAEALLRSVAVRWNLPENLVTGSAANNNFASSLVAETPFVKYAESQQQFYVQRDRKTLERVLWMAWQAGRLGDVPWDAIKRNVNIVITPPQIEARDPQKETQVRKTLFEAGVLSKKTWAAQEGLDFEQEQKNLQMEAEAAKKANPQAGGQPQPGQHRKTVAQSLEETPWDPAKHPRGGNPENTGEFSKVDGANEAKNGSPSEASAPEKEKLSEEDLYSYFELLYGDRGRRLLKAFKESTGVIKIEDVWFAKSDLDTRDAWGPQQIQIDEHLNPAEGAQELMDRLLEASGLTEVRQHLSHYGFKSIDDLIESYRQSFKQSAATVAAAAELYLSGISVVNEGADWVVTIHELSEGNIYAALAFLPLIPAVVAKGGFVLKHGKQTIRISAEAASTIKALPVDELVHLLESTRNLARNMAKAGLVRPANTAAHHIVPRALKKFDDAVAAQEILRKFGIGLENAANGVYLPSKFDDAVKAAYHGEVHTKTYYKELFHRLKVAKSKDDVLIILDRIRNDLLSGNFPIK